MKGLYMKNITPLLPKITAIFIAIFVLTISIAPEIYNFSDTTEPEVIEAKPVDQKQLKCLAENIYFEAKGESLNGQAAVARIVMNRITHGFASTPCNVIHQFTYVTKINEETLDTYRVKMCQFSWVCEGKPKPNPNDPKYIKALDIAHDVLAYDAYEDVLPRTALFFHNLTVDPLWPYKQVAKIGNHIFYSKAKKDSKQLKNSV